MKKLLLAGLLLLPNYSFASIYISEIAWMGSSVSANHEWIEIHNQGSSVDVTGWTVTDGMNLEIELEGTLTGGSYSVLERTSDDSAPGNALVIYTGALVNTGATLSLRREDGTLVDQVSGGDNWGSIGGDNVTKETAQYTSSGWVTAAATPAQRTADTDLSPDESEDEASEDQVVAEKSSYGSTNSVPLVLPGNILILDVVSVASGYINQPIDFSLAVSGVGSTVDRSLGFVWNFGDGETVSGREVSHSFAYPGKYVVTVHGSFKRQETVSRHEITILPIDLSLTMNGSGDVQINNDSPYEVDLSGFRLRAEDLFVLPPWTIILPNQTITISRDNLGETTNRMISVSDQTGKLIDSILPSSIVEKVPEVVIVDVTAATPLISAAAVSRQTASDEILVEREIDSKEVTAQKFNFSEDSQLASVGHTSQINWPYLLMALLLSISVFASLYKPSIVTNKD